MSIQHGGRDEHTYTTKQLKSAKSTTSGTPELDILIILWEGEGGPLQEILISIDSKLKHTLYLVNIHVLKLNFLFLFVAHQFCI